MLPRVHYQFIVLSVARATGAAFEWQDHVQHALAAGLPQFSSMALPAERALIFRIRSPFARRSCEDPGVATDPRCVAGQAAAKWGKDGLVEIVVVSGFYQMFAAINQGFDIASLKSAAEDAAQPRT